MESLEQRLETPFDIKAVRARFGKSVDYVGSIMHPNIDGLVYAYYQPNPNRDLGHTEFFGLSYTYDYVLGKDQAYVIKLLGEELEEYQWHTGVYCYECSQLIVSLGRHDYQTCDCNKSMADGGSQYMRCYQDNMIVKVNTITLEVKA